MYFVRRRHDQNLHAIFRCFESYPPVSSPSRLRALLPMSSTPHTSAPFVATDSGNCCSQRHNLLTLHMIASDRSRNFKSGVTRYSYQSPKHPTIVVKTRSIGAQYESEHDAHRISPTLPFATRHSPFAVRSSSFAFLPPPTHTISQSTEES